VSAETQPHRCVELCPICRSAEILRESGGGEVRGNWRSVQREALLTMRALIDQYLKRLDGEQSSAPRVEEIPIE
jgi:hypothetical protein